MALIEDDYAVVRRFNGNSEIKTYLGAVITRHVINFMRAERGRWRPSAAALRLGPPAPKLEQLVRHEGYTIEQAGEKLRTAGHTKHSDTELARILAELTERAPLRPLVREPATGLPASPGTSHADERVLRTEGEARRAALMAVLESAMKELLPIDQLVVKLHFGEGHTVADVARALELEQKPLYRRVDRLRAHLRKHMEGAGLKGNDVREYLEGLDAP